MNILYINHYAGSVHHGMEYRPYYLAREWVKLGHKVTIIASSYSHLRSDTVKMPFWRHLIEEDIDGIRYIWIRTPKYSGNGFRRVINIFAFLKHLQKLVPQLVKTVAPNLVIASSTYPFDTKIAYRIAKLLHAKFVYEVHDLWPLTPIELGGKSKYHPYIWSMQLAENFGYRYADKVVSLLPKADSYMHDHGMKMDKFVYIPNGVCIDEWRSQNASLPIEHATKIAQIRAEYKFLFGYAGGMGESNALQYVIEAVAQIPEVALVLIGDGSNRESLIQQAQNAAHQHQTRQNIFFLPRLAKAEVPAFLALMDALYIGWHKLPIYRFGISPNKLFDYMLAAKPILHSVTAGNDLVATADCGISVPAEDVANIIVGIKQMATTSQAQLQLWGQNGRQYVTAHHDYHVLAQDFLHQSLGDNFGSCDIQKTSLMSRNYTAVIASKAKQSISKSKGTVCHITSAHPRHDIRILVKECATLATHEYDVTLIVADGLPDEVYHVGEGGATAYRVAIRSVVRAQNRLKRILFTPKAIYKKVLALKPDVVHFHDPELIFVGVKLAKSGFKVIYDVHEDLPKQVQNKHWIPRLVRPVVAKVVAHIERFAAKRVRCIVAATPIIAKRFQKYNKNTISVCNYPLLKEFFSEESKPNWSQRQNVLCYIGSISQSRGIIPLINSLAISQVSLELAGIVSSDITLDDLSKQSGFAYVHYRGVLGRSEITQLLAQVKVGIVTLLPTASYVESLPIKMFEYMLAGIPIVASNFPLWEEIITQYNCGILVDPEDPGSIAQACNKLLHDQNLAQTMGANGRAAVMQHFNWEAESVLLLNLYHQITA